MLVGLDPGQELGDHQVKEHAWIVVVTGSATFRAGDEEVEAPVGTLARFEPDERHSVSSESGAKLLFLLAPWPGSRPTSTARASSSLRSTTGERLPPGVSMSASFQVCTTAEV